MLINVRGISGSGKSTVVRKIIKLCTGIRPVMVEGRKQPIGYTMVLPNGKNLGIIGHYETACGGCDNIKGMDETFDQIRGALSSGDYVICEGLLISGDVTRISEFKDQLLVVGITKITPQECLDSVNARRREKDPTKEPLGEKFLKRETTRRKSVRSAMRKLGFNGVRVVECDREEAFNVLLEEIGSR